jgi:putative oxidoreductase
MERFLGKYEPYIYALLRIVTGFLFLWHGSQKLLGFPPQQAPPGSPAQGLSPMVATAGAIELSRRNFDYDWDCSPVSRLFCRAV